MATKANTLSISPTNFIKLKEILKLNPALSIKELLSQVELIRYEEAGSTYILVHYKSYEKNIDSYWKQFRGIIVKDYSHTVCVSNGHTPNLKVEDSIKKHIENKNGINVLTLEETADNGKVIKHSIPLVKKQFYLRPSFQGTVVRVWLSNGIVHYSSLRKFSIENSVWNNTDVEKPIEEVKIHVNPEEKEEVPAKEKKENVTFYSMFKKLSKLSHRQLFTPGVLNSPFCHVFLMCTPQASSYSRIDTGEGYVLYLETTICYDPIKNTPSEEYLSHFLSPIKQKPFPLSKEDEKAGFLTEEESKYNVRSYLDRYVFPLGSPDPDNYMAKFIPPPTTADHLKKYSAIYNEKISMSLSEADRFLTRGLDLISSDRDLEKLKKKNPLYTPGEALYLTCIIKDDDGVRTQNYILTPPCVNFKIAMLGYLGNMQSQLVLLRRQAIADPSVRSDTAFRGMATDLETSFFEDIVQIFDGSKNDQIKDNFYYGISNENVEMPPPPADSNYSLLKPPTEGMLIYKVEDMKKLFKQGGRSHERDSYGSTRWYILAYHYCLCLAPQRRAMGWIAFSKMYQLYIETMNFMTDNYAAIHNPASVLYTTKSFANHTKQAKSGIERMRAIIDTAMTKKYSEDTKKLKTIEPDFTNEENKLPVSASETPTVENKEYLTYAKSLKASDRETNPTIIMKNIRNLIRKEDAVSLYHMMKIVRHYITKKATNPDLPAEVEQVNASEPEQLAEVLPSLEASENPEEGE